MTCNQLIALLECYRTGRPTMSGLGTIQDDVKYLVKRELVVIVSKDKIIPTEEGTKKIEAILDLL